MVDVPGADFWLATTAAPRSWCGLYIPNHALPEASGDFTASRGLGPLLASSKRHSNAPIMGWLVDSSHFERNTLREQLHSYLCTSAEQTTYGHSLALPSPRNVAFLVWGT